MLIGLRLLAMLMASITLVTTALFAHALATADEQPPPPTVGRIASR